MTNILRTRADEDVVGLGTGFWRHSGKLHRRAPERLRGSPSLGLFQAQGDVMIEVGGSEADPAVLRSARSLI